MASTLALSNSHFFKIFFKVLILVFKVEISFSSIKENLALQEILYTSKSFCVDMSVEDKSSFCFESITILF